MSRLHAPDLDEWMGELDRAIESKDVAGILEATQELKRVRMSEFDQNYMDLLFAYINKVKDFDDHSEDLAFAIYRVFYTLFF